jgi:hypothetical protein
MIPRAVLAVAYATCRKIQRLRPGLNPRTREPEASMRTTRPPEAVKLKVKFSKFVPVRAVTTYEKMMVYLSPLFLNLGCRERWGNGQNHNPAASLSTGKETPYPLNRRMSGNRSRSACFRERVSLSALPRIETLSLGSPAPDYTRNE